MRVLLVSEDLPAPILGGAGKHAVTLGNALLEAGHQVEMLGRAHNADAAHTLGFAGPLHQGIDLAGTGWQEYRWGAFLPLRRKQAARRVWAAIQAVGLERFDVIHYHGHLYALGAVVPRDVPLVQTVHDQGTTCLTMTRFRNGQPCDSQRPADCAACAVPKPNVVQRALSAAAARDLRANATAAFARHEVIFVSDFLRRRFQETLPPPQTLRAQVVHNFTADRAQMSPTTPAVPGRAEASESLGKPRLLMVGRLDGVKGIGSFLDQLTPAQWQRWQVRVVGDGPEGAAMRQTFEAQGAVFCGYLSQQATYEETNAAAVCVVPSLCEEACATTVLEALAMGKPVLALARGGTPELTAYQRYPHQLTLANDLPALAQQLNRVHAPPGKLGAGKDESVNARLPSILAVYATCMAAVRPQQAVCTAAGAKP